MIFKNGRYYTKGGVDITDKFVGLVQSHASLTEVVSETHEELAPEDYLPWVGPFEVLPLPN